VPEAALELAQVAETFSRRMQPQSASLRFAALRHSYSAIPRSHP
jgi:hypothetical protein